MFQFTFYALFLKRIGGVNIVSFCQVWSSFLALGGKKQSLCVPHLLRLFNLQQQQVSFSLTWPLNHNCYEMRGKLFSGQMVEIMVTEKCLFEILVTIRLFNPSNEIRVLFSRCLGSNDLEVKLMLGWLLMLCCCPLGSNYSIRHFPKDSTLTHSSSCIE